MKKILSFAMMALAILTIASCSNNTPEEIKQLQKSLPMDLGEGMVWEELNYEPESKTAVFIYKCDDLYIDELASDKESFKIGFAMEIQKSLADANFLDNENFKNFKFVLRNGKDKEESITISTEEFEDLKNGMKIITLEAMVEALQSQAPFDVAENMSLAGATMTDSAVIFEYTCDFSSEEFAGESKTDPAVFVQQLKQDPQSAMMLNQIKERGLSYISNYKNNDGKTFKIIVTPDMI